jgi:hypothetical protein
VDASPRAGSRLWLRRRLKVGREGGGGLTKGRFADFGRANRMDLGELFVGFLLFFAEQFDLRGAVVCVRTGRGGDRAASRITRGWKRGPRICKVF